MIEQFMIYKANNNLAEQTNIISQINKMTDKQLSKNIIADIRKRIIKEKYMESPEIFKVASIEDRLLISDDIFMEIISFLEKPLKDLQKDTYIKDTYIKDKLLEIQILLYTDEDIVKFMVDKWSMLNYTVRKYHKDNEIKILDYVKKILNF